MAARKAGEEPRRLNRAVGVGEALGGVLDPVLKRRGFASRDIVAHWSAMAPAPYDRVTRPEKLSWPRGTRGAEGAVLQLSCHPGHRLALQHEGQRVAAAVNRYFGYVLVKEVRISGTPFAAPEAAEAGGEAPLGEAVRARIADSLRPVEDPGLRAALQQLGQALARRRGR